MKLLPDKFNRDISIYAVALLLLVGYYVYCSSIGSALYTWGGSTNYNNGHRPINTFRHK